MQWKKMLKKTRFIISKLFPPHNQSLNTIFFYFIFILIFIFYQISSLHRVFVLALLLLLHFVKKILIKDSKGAVIIIEKKLQKNSKATLSQEILSFFFQTLHLLFHKCNNWIIKYGIGMRATRFLKLLAKAKYL